MKIVVLHGVGFFTDNPPDHLLLHELNKLPNCETIWYNWKHNMDIPLMDKLDYSDIRTWICEVILDFQTVVKHAFDVDIPDADIYVGHSAGSILALVQSKPAIIFGSPAILVESVQGIDAADCLVSSQPVLNIVHKKDVLAYPLPFANNVIVSDPWWKITAWNPVADHSCYWDDKRIVKIITDTITEWINHPPE